MKIQPAGLARKELYKLFLSVIVPRPIAFVSTVGEDGVFNAAPFSFFAGISSRPPLLAVSISLRRGEKKDTLRNIEHTKDFVVNVVNEGLAEKMNIASGDYLPQISEFDLARLTPAKSDLVRAPRILESPVNLECRLLERFKVGASENTLVIGEIVLFHVEDAIYADGEVDTSKLKPVGRLGEDSYCKVHEIFKMKRP